MSEFRDENIKILQNVDLFAGLVGQPQALHKISEIMKVIELDEGQCLLTEGEVGDDFFILVSGQVSVFKKTSDGDLYKVAILTDKKSHGLGEAGLIESEPRSATVVCNKKSQFLLLNRHVFSQFCDQNPGWAIPILRKIAVQLIARLRQTDHDILLLHKALMNEIRG